MGKHSETNTAKEVIIIIKKVVKILKKELGKEDKK
jgi:hypothetical protein